MKFQAVTQAVILLFSWQMPCTAQVVSIGIGQMFYNSKTIVPVIHQFEERNNKGYNSLDFTFPEIDRYLLGLELSTYPGWVDFNAPGETWLGFGSKRTNLYRVSPYFGYIIQPKRKFNWIPYFKLVLEQSIITGLNPGFGRVTEIDEAFGYKGTIFIEPIKRLQVSPGAGFLISWNPLGRLYLRGNVYYAYGYRAFQKYYFEYSYQGIEQPTAEWHSNGTGVFTTIGAGVRIGKVKDD